MIIIKKWSKNTAQGSAAGRHTIIYLKKQGRKVTRQDTEDITDFNRLIYRKSEISGKNLQKSKDIQFTIMYNTEKLQMRSFNNLQSTNVYHYYQIRCQKTLLCLAAVQQQ